MYACVKNFNTCTNSLLYILFIRIPSSHPFPVPSTSDQTSSSISQCNTLHTDQFDSTNRSDIIARSSRSLPSDLHLEVYYRGNKNKLSGHTVTATDIDTFDFLYLDELIQLKVISMLNPCERGMLSSTCKKLNNLVREKSLWRAVDLCALPMCYNNQFDNHHCSSSCFKLYKTRVKSFFSFVQNIRPNIRQLRFSLDIGKKDWQNELETLMNVCTVKNLDIAHLDWTKNSSTPYIVERLNIMNKDMYYMARRRTRPFKKFFERFTEAAPNVSVLVMPFNWEDHCMSYFSRLRQLRKLVLYKYIDRVDPSLLNELLENVPGLEKLQLEIHCSPSPCLRMYNVKHRVLKHLDISQCLGLYMYTINLPELRELKMSRGQWSVGPFLSSPQVVPCMHKVLAEGAPNLERLNEHLLKDGWQYAVYPELENLLKTICSCPLHKDDWQSGV